jgi:hypothetical protein
MNELNQKNLFKIIMFDQTNNNNEINCYLPPFYKRLLSQQKEQNMVKKY